MFAKQIFECLTCNELCMENVKELPDGTIVHTVCGTKVEDVTWKIDEHSSAPSDSCD